MQRYPALTLAAFVAVAAAVWIGVLPVLASRPDFAERWRRTELAGIDPGAFNYRELPAAEDIHADLQRRKAARPEAWAWPFPSFSRVRPVQSAPTKVRADFD